MLKRLLAVDGVTAVCRFRDDGGFVEGYGMLDEERMARLAKFAHYYKRLVQGNTDQFAMFTQRAGWTPPKGWIVRGARMSVCSVANVVCLTDNREGSLQEIMNELGELAHQ